MIGHEFNATKNGVVYTLRITDYDAEEVSFRHGHPDRWTAGSPESWDYDIINVDISEADYDVDLLDPEIYTKEGIDEYVTDAFYESVERLRS
jgi:hypothetical protein